MAVLGGLAFLLSEVPLQSSVCICQYLLVSGCICQYLSVSVRTSALSEDLFADADAPSAWLCPCVAVLGGLVVSYERGTPVKVSRSLKTCADALIAWLCACASVLRWPHGELRPLH